MTLKVSDLLVDVNTIMKTCAGDGKTPFKGEQEAGEGKTARTVRIYDPPAC